MAGLRNPAFNNYGTILGLQTLRIFKNTHVILQQTGQTSCIRCFFAGSNVTEFPGHYYFGSVAVMKGAYITVYSRSSNVKTSSVKIFVDYLDVENTGYISVDAVQIIAVRFKIEKNAKVTSSGRAWSLGQGRAGCGSCAGAGHGGRGGYGYRECHNYYSGQFQTISCHTFLPVNDYGSDRFLIDSISIQEHFFKNKNSLTLQHNSDGGLVISWIFFVLFSYFCLFWLRFLSNCLKR